MSTAIAEHTVLPPDEPLDELVDLVVRITADQRIELVSPDGRRMELPPAVYDVLREVVLAMSRGQAVTIAPHNQRLTTQEAADILGISRPTLVRFLDEGRIPFEKPGRHRRVLLVDILAFQKQLRMGRQEGLDELIRVSEETDLYRKTSSPERTR